MGDITYIMFMSIVGVSLLLTVVRMHVDVWDFQQVGYDVGKYNEWSKTTSESISFNRIVCIVVLFICLSTLGESWMVLAIGLVMLLGAMGYLLATKRGRYRSTSPRSWRLLGTELLLSIIIICVIGFFTRSAKFVLLLTLAICGWSFVLMKLCDKLLNRMRRA